jgi:hypothetical protein
MLVSFFDEDSILNHVKLGRKQGKPGLPGGVGPDDLSVEENSKVTLLLQKREEWFELRVAGNVDRKEDESLLVAKVFEAPRGNGIAGVWTNNIT